MWGNGMLIHLKTRPAPRRVRPHGAAIEVLMSDQSGPPFDRRKRRSDETQQAIFFQLLHLLEEYDLHNLVMADEAGVMVACAGDEEQGEELAACAPIFSRRLNRGGRDQIKEELQAFLPEASDRTLSVRQFNLEGEDHFLIVVGEEALCRQATLYRAITGIRRIVDDTSAE